MSCWCEWRLESWWHLEDFRGNLLLMLWDRWLFIRSWSLEGYTLAIKLFFHWRRDCFLFKSAWDIWKQTFLWSCLRKSDALYWEWFKVLILILVLSSLELVWEAISNLGWVRIPLTVVWLKRGVKNGYVKIHNILNSYFYKFNI